MPNSVEAQDLVLEARELANDVRFDIQPRVRSSLRALCDEVERLRKQQKVHAEMVDDYYGSR